MLTPIRRPLAAALKPLEPFYFLGIGGSGMAPLAHFIHAAGAKVSGFDQASGAQNNPELAGIEVSSDAEDFSTLDLVKTVVRSSAIKDDHPWLQNAAKRGLKIIHRSELLAEISNSFKLITVSGTHGKSTTSALVAFLLRALGTDPSYILGAALLGEDGSSGGASHLGSSEWLVIESDESDGSFLNYRPQIAVVTNIDADHMEHYGSMDRMVSAFKEHLSHLAEDGVAVLFWDHERVRELGFDVPLEKRCAYGTYLGTDVRMTAFSQDGLHSKFSVMVNKTKVAVTLPQIGHHNAINSLAALAVVHTMALPLELAAKALSSFPGVARRLTLYFESPTCLVYDDYAHNPVKTASCLQGLRSAFPKSCLIAVFQPHRYSRLQHLYDDFMKAFVHADKVIVLPVYAAGESPLAWATSERLATDINSASQVATQSCGSLKEAEELLQYTKLEKHTVIVTIGAGDVWTVARNFADFLNNGAIL